MAVGVFSLGACTSEIAEELSVRENETITLSDSDRLKFDSREEFNLVMMELAENNGQFYSEHLEMKCKEFPEFHSVARMVEEPSEEIKGAFNKRMLSEDPELVGELVSELVPDMNFRELLNEKLEVEVNDTIYKVTEYGTFYAHSNHYGEIEKTVDDFAKAPQKVGFGESARISQEGNVYYINSFGDETNLMPAPDYGVGGSGGSTSHPPNFPSTNHKMW